MNMTLPTVILGILAAVLVYIGYKNGEGQHVVGLNNAWKMTLQVLPLVVMALIVAGMSQALIPQAGMTKWIGGESGMKGIMIGTVAGSLAPGGPFVSMPIALGMLKAGAGVGTMVAFLTSWSLMSLIRLPLEVGILGWKLTLMRLSCSFFIPPLTGLLAQTLYGNVQNLH